MKSSFLHLVVWSLLCGAVFAAYGYWYNLVSDKSVAVAALQEEINAKTEAVNRTSSARVTLAQVASDEAAIQRYFVPEAGIVPFINDLEARAKAQAADLKVLSVSTSGGTKQPILILSLTVDGTFDAVMRTLGTIEFAPYAVTLSKLALIENGKGAWHLDLNLSVGSVAGTNATSTPPAASKPVSFISSYDHF